MMFNRQPTRVQCYRDGYNAGKHGRPEECPFAAPQSRKEWQRGYRDGEEKKKRVRAG